ncbi:Heterokaryon incompatibility protein 6, OR allele [Cytospora mali]|uniref:Heterokaryon incompatibility protein 6, OR allele n=1 Tax=Cytospora mali TaxID=578113 RepID=A0A194VES7_CYTMA|nr:Heterokaryon incompatibility protein 6, OR allele [Valsa mali var. pyri (nom. inval.)]
MSFDHSYHFAGFKPINEPVVRIIDFSDNMVVRQVSTMARRMWLLNPPLSHEEQLEESALKTCFRSTVQEIGSGIAEAPEEARWDHQLWLSHNDRLLDPVVLAGAAPHDTRSVVSPWRSEIYDIYKHIFIDLWRKLKKDPNTDHLGEFNPGKDDSVTLGVLQAETLKIDKMGFDTDTFLYPVWVNPRAQIAFSVEGVVGKEHVWSNGEPSAWSTGLWLLAGKELTMTTKMDTDGDETGVAAVFMMGHCEKGNLMHLKEEFRDKSTKISEPADGPEAPEQESDDEMPEFVAEADHLARAIFLKAGDAVRECTFDNVDRSLDAVPTGMQRLQLDSQEHEKLYEPFSNDHSIRILIVEPESAGPELRTHLQVVDLNDDPQYEAMSYTWGDPKDKTPLKVQQDEVQIPQNLEDALKRLRYPDRRRYIWADAVCINQDDVPERGQQVSIMRSIYLKARNVVVWLGQDNAEQAEAAFAGICEIVRSWRPSSKPLRFSSYKEAFEPDNKGLIIDEEKWAALQAMFQVEYFTRFWVIQELVLGSSATIVWGDHQISWGLIGICAAWLLTRGWMKNPEWPISAAYNAFLIYVLPLARRSAISSFSKLDLSAVLAMTMGNFKSTDPRDRIYALLGIPFSGNDPEKGTLVDPDYTVDVRSVYLTATKRMLTQDSNLRLLSAVQHGLEIDTSYPSWLPKWDQSLFAEPLASRQEHGYYANAGELFFPDKETIGDDGESLIVTGLKGTAITDVSGLFTAGNISLPRSDNHRAAMLATLAYLNDQGQQVRASWSATLEKNVIPGFNDPEKQAELVTSAEGMRMAATTGIPGKYGMRMATEILDGEKMGIDNLGEFLLYWRERCTWDVEALKHEDFKDFWEAVEKDGSPYTMERALCSMNAFLGRRVFHCEDGKFGLGPAAMRPGDVVTVLFGGIVPYVLRPLDDDGQAWAFVGECIVPMLMQGQAVEAAGLLAEATYSRDEDGMLRLDPPENEDLDPRLHREVGKNGVMRFDIR